MNLVPALVSSIGATVGIDLPGGAQLDVPALPDGVAVGDEVTLGVRPEHLLAGSRDGVPSLELEVYVSEPLGGETILYGHVGDRQTLVVKVLGSAHLQAGQRVVVSPIPEMCHLFDGDGIALPRPEGTYELGNDFTDLNLGARLS